MTYYFGIDLGGTSAKLALVDSRFKVIRETSVSTKGFPNPALLARHLAEASRTVIGSTSIKQVGVGVAGDIDFDKGVVRISPNLGWKNVPLKKYLHQHFKRPVIVDNDANAAAWGIYKTQVSKKVQNLLVLTLGTGVGGGIILNGEVYRGETGSAGEVGHMTMNEHGRRCNCGDYGCLETYAGAIYLIRMVKEALEKGQKSSLQEIYKRDARLLTPLAMAQAARKKDPFAMSLWEQVGHMLGLAIGNLVYIFNPELIVLTGGVAQAKGLILRPLWKTLKKRAFKTPIQKVEIKVAENAPLAGVIGASLL